MNRWFFLLILIVFSDCSDQIKKTKHNALPSSLSFFNNKLKKGLEKDSLAYYVLQLDEINKGHVPDSLQQEFLFAQFRYTYRLGQIDSAISILHHVIGLSDPKVLSAPETKYYISLMNVYYQKNDFLNCLGTSEKAISLFKTDDLKNKGRTYNLRQRSYTALENYSQALKENLLAQEVFEIAKDTSNIINNQIGRASIYFYNQNDLEKALATLKNTTIDISKLSSSINYRFHGTMGSILFEKKLYDQALIAFQKATKYNKERASSNMRHQSLINNYINLSNTYLELNQLEKSNMYIDSVFTLGFEKIGYLNQKAALKTRLQIGIKEPKNLLLRKLN